MSRIQGNDYYVNNTRDPVTGSEKVKIVSDANGTVRTEKMSYHNPITGVSETYKNKTKAERSRSRSRSNSSERRRRNVQYQNGYAQMPVNSTQPMPINNGIYHPQNLVNDTYGPPINYNQQMPVHNAPIYNQPLGTYNQNDLYSHEKGSIKTTDNSYKMTEKKEYVNPITGVEENSKVKHKIVGDRSRSRSQGKSKTTYDHINDGQKVVIKEKHREGGVMSNIKNKMKNLVNRG